MVTAKSYISVVSITALATLSSCGDIIQCPPDFAIVNQQCANERQESCKDVAPANGSSEIVEVTSTYSDATGWVVPECAWSCDPGFVDNDIGSCVQECTPDSCGESGVCDLASRLCVYASCYHLRQAYPGAPDGVYTIQPALEEPPVEVYCDMSAGGWTYEALGFGIYSQDLGSVYAGWLQLGAADLRQPGVQQAFVWAYNRQGGLINIAPGSASGECCFKGIDTGAEELLLPSVVRPAATDDNCIGPYTDERILLEVEGTPASASLPASFFAGGVQTADVCEDSLNPAFFLKRTTGLSSCREIRDASLSVGDQIYLIDPDGLGPLPRREVVCDMASGATIHEIAFGNVSLEYPDHRLMGLADFTSPSVLLAFLWNYGRVNGFANLSPGAVSNNCCFKLGEVEGWLNFGGSRVYPATGAGQLQCNGAYTDSIMRFYLSGTPTQPPLPRSYFEAVPPQEAPGCSLGDNPAYFIRRSP